MVPLWSPEGPKAGSQSRCLWSYRQGRDKGLGCSPGSHWAPADPPAPKAGRVRFPCGKYRNMGKQNTAHTAHALPGLKSTWHLSCFLPLSLPLPNKPLASVSSQRNGQGSGSSSMEHYQAPGAMVPCCVREFQSSALCLDTWRLWDEASLCSRSGLCPRPLGSRFLSPAAAPQMRCFVQRPVASSTGN